MAAPATSPERGFTVDGSQHPKISSVPQFPQSGGHSVWGRGFSWCAVELTEAGIHQEIHSPAAGEGVSGVSGCSLGYSSMAVKAGGWLELSLMSPRPQPYQNQA